MFFFLSEIFFSCITIEKIHRNSNSDELCSGRFECLIVDLLNEWLCWGTSTIYIKSTCKNEFLYLSRCSLTLSMLFSRGRRKRRRGGRVKKIKSKPHLRDEESWEMCCSCFTNNNNKSSKKLKSTEKATTKTATKGTTAESWAMKRRRNMNLQLRSHMAALRHCVFFHRFATNYCARLVWMNREKKYYANAERWANERERETVTIRLCAYICLCGETLAVRFVRVWDAWLARTVESIKYKSHLSICTREKKRWKMRHEKLCKINLTDFWGFEGFRMRKSSLKLIVEL